MEKLKQIIAKIKSVKNIEIIIGLVIIAVMIIIYSNVSEKKAESDISDGGGAALTANLESRLADILGEIEGAGEVKVMITYADTGDKVTASTTNTHTTTTNGSTSSSTTTTTTSSPILSGSDVVILEEKMPEIKGVIVVAEGAGDMKVKLKLMQATATVLGINANSIQIFTRRAV